MSHNYYKSNKTKQNQSPEKKEARGIKKKLSSEMRLADNGATRVSEVAELERRSNRL